MKGGSWRERRSVLGAALTVRPTTAWAAERRWWRTLLSPRPAHCSRPVPTTGSAGRWSASGVASGTRCGRVRREPPRRWALAFQLDVKWFCTGAAGAMEGPGRRGCPTRSFGTRRSTWVIHWYTASKSPTFEAQMHEPEPVRLAVGALAKDAGYGFLGDNYLLIAGEVTPEAALGTRVAYFPRARRHQPGDHRTQGRVGQLILRGLVSSGSGVGRTLLRDADHP